MGVAPNHPSHWTNHDLVIEAYGTLWPPHDFKKLPNGGWSSWNSKKNEFKLFYLNSKSGGWTVEGAEIGI